MKELNEYTKQNKKIMYCKNTSQKIAMVTIRTATCESPSYQYLPCIHNAPIQWAMRYAYGKQNAQNIDKLSLSRIN